MCLWNRVLPLGCDPEDLAVAGNWLTDVAKLDLEKGIHPVEGTNPPSTEGELRSTLGESLPETFDGIFQEQVIFRGCGSHLGEAFYRYDVGGRNLLNFRRLVGRGDGERCGAASTTAVPANLPAWVSRMFSGAKTGCLYGACQSSSGGHASSKPSLSGGVPPFSTKRLPSESQISSGDTPTSWSVKATLCGRDCEPGEPSEWVRKATWDGLRQAQWGSSGLQCYCR